MLSIAALLGFASADEAKDESFSEGAASSDDEVLAPSEFASTVTVFPDFPDKSNICL